MSNGMENRKVSRREYKTGIYYQFNIPKKWGDKYIDKAEEVRVIERDNELILRPRKNLNKDQTYLGG